MFSGRKVTDKFHGKDPEYTFIVAKLLYNSLCSPERTYVHTCEPWEGKETYIRTCVRVCVRTK